MNYYEKYTAVDVSSDGLQFEFTSKGPKGEIKKIVQFSPTKAKDVLNLAFGNFKDDGSIDDATTNDNKDRDKILATIAQIVYDFTAIYPDKYIFFTGSTKERNRLYRMAITLNFDELAKTFLIWGLAAEEGFEPFQKRKNYDGFLIERK